MCLRFQVHFGEMFKLCRPESNDAALLREADREAYSLGSIAERIISTDPESSIGRANRTSRLENFLLIDSWLPSQLSRPASSPLWSQLN